MRKSFFGQGKCIITGHTQGATVEEAITQIKTAADMGADGIAVQLGDLPPELRTRANYRKFMDAAPELPFMFILYRNDKWFGKDDDARQKYLLDAADEGAEVIDVMGDLYAPADFELAVDPGAVEKQKSLIREIHAKGAKVVMSSHMFVPRTCEQVLAQMREQSDRGADLLKVVTKVDTPDELFEAIRTTMTLKKVLDKPFIFLSNGLFCKPHRALGPKMGVAVTFGLLEGDRQDSMLGLGNARALFDHLEWNAPETK